MLSSLLAAVGSNYGAGFWVVVVGIAVGIAAFAGYLALRIRTLGLPWTAKSDSSVYRSHHSELEVVDQAA